MGQDDKKAPHDTVYVCSVCGRRSYDRKGYFKVNQTWDESCRIHSVLCYRDSLIIKDGLVVSGIAAEDF